MIARPPHERPDIDPSSAHELPRGARGRVARRHEPGNTVGERVTAPHREIVAEEAPVALIYDDRPFAVIMASPVDLEDFAAGFSLTEGIVAEASECEAIEVQEQTRGWELRITLAAPRAEALQARVRALAGRTGGGLSGVESIAEALRPVERPETNAVFLSEVIVAAVAAFPGYQVLNHATGASHAAAFVDAAGRIVALREDVGRHNAVDKLIGALARDGFPMSRGFVMVSSRCSYEMVHKVAAAGIAVIVSVSAPTGLAIDLASRVGVGLAAFARDGRFTVYACDKRFEGDPEAE